MTTETILHGYQIILVPRLPPNPPEVVITAPYRVTDRFTILDLDRWIEQLKRELKVMQAGREILIEAMLGDGEQIAGGDGHGVVSEEAQQLIDSSKLDTVASVVGDA